MLPDLVRLELGLLFGVLLLLVLREVVRWVP